MTISIFHTADIHIGMMFNKYPDDIKVSLREARVEVLENMIDIANENNCQIFAITGDLFDKTTGIDKKTILKASKHLRKFNGNCLLLLPGNHDFDNGMIDLWKTFNDAMDDKLLFLRNEQPYKLDDYGVEATVYPAPCHSKHSTDNNLSWIKESEIDKSRVNIGIAHGSLKGISPDLDNTYFSMGIDELMSIPVDLWLLGHSHIVYPEADTINNWTIFNPGTPEPDGLDCSHMGNSFIITINDDKSTTSKRVQTGKHSFIDKQFRITDYEDFVNMKDYFDTQHENTIARIQLKGKVDEDIFSLRNDFIKKIEEKISCLIVEDTELRIRINKEKIEKEFTNGSFPEQFLLELKDEEEALQLAYEMIMEVKR